MPGRSASRHPPFLVTNMLPYLLRRSLFLVISLVVAMIVIFVLLRLLPGRPGERAAVDRRHPRADRRGAGAGRLGPAARCSSSRPGPGSCSRGRPRRLVHQHAPGRAGDRRAPRRHPAARPCSSFVARARARARHRHHRRRQGRPLVRHRAVRLLAAGRRRAGVLGRRDRGRGCSRSSSAGFPPAASRATTGRIRAMRCARSRCRS